MKRLVLYHGGCYDGFTAAWAAWRKFGEDAEYRPVNYGHEPPADWWDRDLYIVDFSYPRRALESRALDPSHTLGVTALRVLDHHKTAEADLRGLSFCRFDMERSGATLAWEEFHAEPAPLIVRYVEDRDLWRFALDGSREVSAWMRSWPFTFEAWNEAHQRLETGLRGVIAEGTTILRFQSQMVSVMCDHAWWQDIGGHRVPVANATVFYSEVGEELCKRHPDVPFAAYYTDRGEDGKRQWGLRSRGNFDVSAIAKQYGGGGHKAAAGFVADLPT
jgi:hypothetical protein